MPSLNASTQAQIGDNAPIVAKFASGDSSQRLMQAANDTARFEALQAERDDRWATLLTQAARVIQAAPEGGSIEAARELFAEFYAQSASLALTVARRVATERFAEDVLSESFIQAWKSLLTFDANRGRASAWLLTIVRSRALDKLRSEKLRRTESLDATNDAESSSASLIEMLAEDASLTPHALLESTESRTLVHRAMADLSHNERWVLSLAYFRDLSHSEIAHATALPLGTVKSLTSRALSKLRKALT